MSATAPVGLVEAPFTTDAEIVQFQTPGLGDSSYLLRSGDAAAVIDPQRDVERFVRVLEDRGARLLAVVETHIHNDYVSGGAALARGHTAEYVVPAGAGFEQAHRGVREGDLVAVGALRLRALHTPGHTPHHTSYQVIEGTHVRAVFSGGCVLVGACGRTDLMGSELAVPLARQQYRSAQRLGALPGPTAIGPTHGAGSLCAASAAVDDTWTTVAREWARNPAFLARDEDDFVRTQLAGLPDHPTYYRHMAPINRRGAPAWVEAVPPRLQPEEVERMVAAGAVLVDGRSRREFAQGHIPGSLNLELDPQFSLYLGWLYPFGTRFVVVLAPTQDPVGMALQAARIGIETIVGDAGLEAWRAGGRRVEVTGLVDVDGLRAATVAGGVRVLDVRQEAEWRNGHLPGAIHIHVADLPARLAELRGAQPVYVYCASGHRAAMGSSLLLAAGIPAVTVDGGYGEWMERGYPVEREPAG